MSSLFGVALRLSIMYFYALLMLRLSGKRSISTISPLDLIVGLILGDLFDDVIWATTPFTQALVAFTTIILLHASMNFATYQSKSLNRLVNSRKTELVVEGNIVEKDAAAQRMQDQDILSMLRLMGEDRLDRVKEASLEPDGRLSLERCEGAKKAQKQDLPRLEELYP